MEGVKPQEIIRLSKSSIGKDEIRAVTGVLEREYLGMGAEVQKFEEGLTEFFGRPSVCVVNGTAALHLALQACDIGIGDEVLVQSLTYIASFQTISATGAIPVACDIDPNTLTLDLRDAEKRITSRTKAVMPVHYGGGVGALDEIYAFAHKHGLRVIEDAAHAFGTKYRGRIVGGFGDISCFSFDGIKNITSGEGGCIVTDDQEVLRKIRDARLLGVERDTDRRYIGQRSWEFDVAAQGWRYHMSNIMAAIGIEQLKRFPGMAAKRQKLANHYSNLLSKSKQISLLNNNFEHVVPHIFVVKINNKCDRSKVRAGLEELGIQTGIHYFPNHFLTLYHREMLGGLVNTENIYPTIISLPMQLDLSFSDIEKICKSLNEVIDQNIT